MSEGISKDLLQRLSDFVAERIGLNFPKERFGDLERGIICASREFGCWDPKSCIEMLTSSQLTKEQTEVLASNLTVGETYFFREGPTFKNLEEVILPQIMQGNLGRKRMRIWSAGCASGEEPYSIAILLNKIIPDIGKWNITIQATDINPRFLQKAEKGVYGEWSFRDTPAWVKERYFRKTKEGRFEVHQGIKEMVTFSYHNLAGNAYPSLLTDTNAMDLVLCRNVIMYFTRDQQTRVIRKLFQCLVDGGWLVVSPSELSHELFSQFEAVEFQGASFYRRIQRKVRAQLREVPVPEEMVLREFTHPTGYAGQLPETAFLPAPLPPVSKKEEAAAVRIQPAPYAEARALYAAGLYEETEKKLVEFLSTARTHAEAMALLSRVYANQGRLDDALVWVQKAIASDKLNPFHYFLLSTIQQEQGKLEDAVRSAKRALYLDRDFVLAHFMLGNLSRRQGKLTESEKSFGNAAALLKRYRNEDVVEQSDGLTAGRLLDIIRATGLKEKAA